MQRGDEQLRKCKVCKRMFRTGDLFQEECGRRDCIAVSQRLR
jgi:hypothetical protein